MNIKFLLLFIPIFFFSGFCIAQNAAQQLGDSTENIAPQPFIEFEENETDLGTVQEGERVSTVYRFTNTGNAPLVIVNARGGCGCTVAFFPKAPIAPGESSEIEVEFDSSKKLGYQSKKVTVVANTQPASNYLVLKCKVVKNTNDSMEEDPDDYELQTKRKLQSLDSNCVAIFPNPASETLQLELKEYIGQRAKVEIRNQSGQLIETKQIEHITRAATLFDVRNYTPGIYFIRVQMEGINPITQCFVVTD